MSSTEAQRLALLDELFAAFNRHDADGVMACMAPSVVFEAAAGPDVYGRRFAGTEAVRAAFEGVWTTMPDVSWTVTSHAIFGDRALSQWIFRATSADGRRIEAEGCDLFAFEGDRIVSKSAFRKDRPLLPAAEAA